PDPGLRRTARRRDDACAVGLDRAPARCLHVRLRPAGACPLSLARAVASTRSLVSPRTLSQRQTPGAKLGRAGAPPSKGSRITGRARSAIRGQKLRPARTGPVLRSDGCSRAGLAAP